MAQKKQRPKLIIREGLNNEIIVKFTSGTKQHDMNKFMELLYGGFMQGIQLVGAISDDLKMQEELYNYAQAVLTTGIHHAFPKVIEKIKKEEELELEIIASVEAGEGINQETKDLIEKKKADLKTRFSKSNNETLQKQREIISEVSERELEKLKLTEEFLFKIIRYEGSKDLEFSDVEEFLENKFNEEDSYIFMEIIKDIRNKQKDLMKNIISTKESA